LSLSSVHSKFSAKQFDVGAITLGISYFFAHLFSERRGKNDWQALSSLA
jgi:hypothetical protein